jgi:hypothetical protein
MFIRKVRDDKRKAKFEFRFYHLFYSGVMPLFTLAEGESIHISGVMPLFTLAEGESIQ